MTQLAGQASREAWASVPLRDRYEIVSLVGVAMRELHNYDLTVLYESSDLRKYALRLAPEAILLTLDELESAIWTFTSDGI